MSNICKDFHRHATSVLPAKLDLGRPIKGIILYDPILFNNRITRHLPEFPIAIGTPETNSDFSTVTSKFSGTLNVKPLFPKAG